MQTLSVAVSAGSSISQRAWWAMASTQLEPITGVRGRSPSRVQGPGGQRAEAPLKLKAFCPFSYKEGPKDKYLNETI